MNRSIRRYVSAGAECALWLVLLSVLCAPMVLAEGVERGIAAPRAEPEPELEPSASQGIDRRFIVHHPGGQLAADCPASELDSGEPIVCQPMFLLRGTLLCARVGEGIAEWTCAGEIEAPRPPGRSI